MPQVETGRYTRFEKDGLILRIYLLPEGQQEIAEVSEDCKNIHSDDFFLELIEYHLCNGWRLVSPESIGAMTDAIILEDSNGAFYTNIAWYQIHSPVKLMLEKGFCEFRMAT